MPVAIGPRAGLDCALYYSTAFASPTRILIAEAIDVSLTIAKGKIDAMSRASKWKAKLPGMREISLSFGYNYQGDPGDSVFAALRAAFLADTPLIFWVMDNVVEAPGPAGSQGFAFPAMIFDFPIDQALESANKVDIGVDLVRFKETGALVNPTWVTVAPTT
jgi:hypothetical protein